MQLFSRTSSVLILVAALFFFSCNKPASDPNNPANGAYTLSYGDSIIYLRPQSGDYIVSPLTHRAGVYTGFPEGIIINPSTGAINVTQSETGLRYRITHTDPNGVKTNTLVVLSGINYTDKFYRQSQNDSIARVVYNATPGQPLPVSGSFSSEDEDLVLDNNGNINIAASMRAGLFGNNPDNDDKEEVDIEYRLNDASGNSQNKIRVKLYFYNSMATVTQEMHETLEEREEQGVFLQAGISPDPEGDPLTQQAGLITARAVARPRPPCIVIIAN